MFKGFHQYQCIFFLDIKWGSAWGFGETERLPFLLLERRENNNFMERERGLGDLIWGRWEIGLPPRALIMITM